MINNYYGLYDSVAECYTWIGESKNDATFARMCNVLGEDSSTFVGKSPADYTGYKLAEFNDETGTFTNCKKKAWEGRPHE